jgi:hypothetical protein
MGLQPVSLGLCFSKAGLPWAACKSQLLKVLKSWFLNK